MDGDESDKDHPQDSTNQTGAGHGDGHGQHPDTWGWGEWREDYKQLEWSLVFLPIFPFTRWMTVSMLEMVLLLTSSSGSSSSSRERYPDLLRLISEVEIVLRNIWWQATPKLNVCPDYFTSCGISQDHWPRSVDCGWRSSSAFWTCSGHCIGYLGRAGLYQINNHLEPSLGIKRAVSLSEAMLLYSIVFVLFCKNVLLVKVTWNLNWLTDRLSYHELKIWSQLSSFVNSKVRT